MGFAGLGWMVIEALPLSMEGVPAGEGMEVPVVPPAEAEADCCGVIWLPEPVMPP